MGQSAAKPVPTKIKKVPTSNNPPTFGRDPNLNPKDFIVQNVEGEVIMREPGKIKGQQFILEGCKGCDIYLLDHMAQVTIDECVDCRIVMGPCESSNCTFVLAVQQLRTRACHNIDVLLFSQTRPIIESSSNVRFGCYSYSYFNLREQFDKAGLSIWDNRWSEVYDFTPEAGKANSVNVGLEVTHLTLGVKPLPSDVAERVGYTEDASLEPLPRTAGVTNRPNNGASWLVLLTSEENAMARGMEVVHALLAPSVPGSPVLVQTRTTTLDKAQVEEVWGKDNKAAATAIPGKPLVGLEVACSNGQEAEAAINAAIQSVLPATGGQELRFCVRGQDAVVLFFTHWRPEDK